MTTTTRPAHPVPANRTFFRIPQESQMVWVIDRLEGGLAVCENSRRETRDIPVAELPPGVRPGDVLRHRAEGWSVDAEETRKRRAEAEELTKDLWA